MRNDGHLALVGGTIYRSPGEDPVAGGVVIIRDATIVAAGPKHSVAMPSDQVLALMGVMKYPAPEIADTLQAAAAARKLLDAGVDALKLFASSPRGPSLPESAMQAAAAEAHRSGKPVFVHPNSGADVL